MSFAIKVAVIWPRKDTPYETRVDEVALGSDQLVAGVNSMSGVGGMVWKFEAFWEEKLFPLVWRFGGVGLAGSRASSREI